MLYLNLKSLAACILVITPLHVLDFISSIIVSLILIASAGTNHTSKNDVSIMNTR